MAKKEKVANPFAINPKEMEKLTEETSVGRAVAFCNQNTWIKKRCYVCEKYLAIWKEFGDDKELARKMAKDYKTQNSYYMFIVTEDNPDEPILYEVGVQVGDALLKQLAKNKWTDIVQPKAGEGRELEISKADGGEWPKYTVSPVLDKADWDVDIEMINNLPPISDIVSILSDGSIKKMKASTIKMDGSFTFRLLPNSDYMSGVRPFAIVKRHWGFVQEQVDGELPLADDAKDFVPETKQDENEEASLIEDFNEDEPEAVEPEDDDTPFEEEEEAHKKEPVKKKAKKAPKKVVEEVEEVVEGRAECFGDPHYYDDKDEFCYEKCEDFEACTKAVAKKK